MSTRYGLSRSAFPVVTGCLAAILAALIGSSTSAQVQPRFAALPVKAPAPADNPSTTERIELGRLLFWDPILSGEKDVACATCHHPDFGYSDGLDLSIGANASGLGPARAFLPNYQPRLVKRNSQTVLNVAFNGLTTAGGAVPAAAPMFWDVRVQSLETQALEPLKAQEEMRGDGFPAHLATREVVFRLNAIAEYRRLFARAFGGSSAVTEQNLGRALAAFQRTLVATNTPFDRYMRGDTSAMTPTQVSGMEAFQADDPNFDRTVPPRVPSGLLVGGRIK